MEVGHVKDVAKCLNDANSVRGWEEKVPDEEKGTRRCNDCMTNAEMEEPEQQRMNVEPVCKRARV